MTWRCRRCGRISNLEGTCPQCLRPFVQVQEAAPGGPDEPTAVIPPGDEPATTLQPPTGGAQHARRGPPPPERMALVMPWGQQINLPDAGKMVLGRSSDPLRGHHIAQRREQISRAHAEFSRAPDGGVDVVDLGSKNGTYVDGEPVETTPRRVRPGQELRLAQDVVCRVIRINELGEPDDQNDDNEAG